MKLGILSRDHTLYSTKRLVEAANKLGHEVFVVDILKCYMNITSDKPVVYYNNKGEKNELIFDAVIPRIDASNTVYGTAVLRQFEVSGVYTPNPSRAILQSRDKLHAHQLLARKSIGMPITSYAHSADATEDLIHFVGGTPLVVKITESTHGNGVVLAETKKAAECLINAFRGLKANFLVQEFIKESVGSDIRCFVIGDKVVASMQRTSAEGDFRSNLHLGGTTKTVKLTPEERKLAVRAAKVLGLSIAGVDIIRSNRGPLVLEVNSSPGLQGIESVTHKPIAEKIIEFIEQAVAKKSEQAELVR